MTTDGLLTKFAVSSRSFDMVIKFFFIPATNIVPALIGYIGRRGVVTLGKNIFLLFNTEAGCF
jgi:hypothetical protein